MIFLSLFLMFFALSSFVSLVGTLSNDDGVESYFFSSITVSSVLLFILTIQFVNLSKLKHMVNVPMIVMDKSGIPVISDFLVDIILSFVLAVIVQIALTIIFRIVVKKDGVSDGN